jgi:citrate lyase subunit beta/citryl-CoA lyase
MKLRRTMLFMPGNNPGMLQDAAILGSDSIILDLEDAVSLTEKDSARILVREAIKNVNYTGVEVVVRINPLTTEFSNEDIDVIARVKPDALMVPKATEDELIEISSRLDKIEREEGFEDKAIKLIPIVESAYGVENVYSIIKSSDRVVAVLLGGEDLTSDMGVKRTKEGNEIFYARNRVAVACKAMRVDSIDTPFTDTNDFEGLKKDTLLAKSLGMTGKASINPRQIDTIHQVYAPTEAEIIYAQRVLDAMEEAEREGKGVFSLDGKMVDAPVINRAKTTVDLSKKLGLI